MLIKISLVKLNHLCREKENYDRGSDIFFFGLYKTRILSDLCMTKVKVLSALVLLLCV